MAGMGPRASRPTGNDSILPRPAKAPMTKTSTYGVGKRESHNAAAFYNRKLFQGLPRQPLPGPAEPAEVSPIGAWADRIYCRSSEDLTPIPDNSVALAFTSPPYNVGKSYDQDLDLDDYLGLMRRVAGEVYRVLRPGGRYVVNVANLGRSPYLPLHALFYDLHISAGFLPMGEIIWQKAKGASGSCAWGSWKSARAPRLRDVHEYLLVFAKQGYTRPEKGQSDIERDEFLAATLSLWSIPPASAKRVGHPAPFPLALARRVIQLYSYVGDVVLDPFVGSGTTCAAAVACQRHYVGVDISPEYCALAQARIAEVQGTA